jgi:hypothetical protein
MAIIDAKLEFDANVEHLTTEASSSTIDFKHPGDFGAGLNASIVVSVSESMTDTDTNSTVTVTIETDDNEAFSSPKTTQTVGVLPAGSFAGSKISSKISYGTINERFCRLKYTVANGDLTTGKFHAYIVFDQETEFLYPSGLS